MIPSKQLSGFVAVFCLCTLSVAAVPVAADSVVNGDFATGDLSGWTVGAIDDGAGAIDPTPFVAVESFAGDDALQMSTQDFGDGLFIATLEQQFTVDVANPFFSLDFVLPEIDEDFTGAAASPFYDALVVSIDDGTDTIELLQIDQFGALANPFGSASFDVELGEASDADYDFSLLADLSSMVGLELTLFIDLIQEDDGYVFVSALDNIRTGAAPAVQPVPEPASLWLVGFGVMGWALVRNRRRS